MESASKYTYKLDSFRAALSDFEKSMYIDFSELDDLIKDTLLNGQIQKFEVTIEILWKTLRAYLIEFHGIEKNSPKSVIKEFFNVRDINEEDYNKLFDMLDDRNTLSHTYSEEDFKEVHKKLPGYLQVLKKILDVIEK